MNKTLAYYDENAAEYAEKTFNVDISENWRLFEETVAKHIKTKPIRIMDLGCASCRDTIHFRELGWDVVPVDGSKGFVDYAAETLDIEVLHADFDSLDFDGEFDAVWAMSSLHHSTPDEFRSRLSRVVRGMKETAVLYVSVLEGERGTFEDEHGRLFLTLEPDDAIDIVDSVAREYDKKFELKSWSNPHIKLPYNWLNLIVVFYEGE